MSTPVPGQGAHGRGQPSGVPWRGGPPSARLPPPAPRPQLPAPPQPPPARPPALPDPARLVGRAAAGDSPARKLWRGVSRMLASNAASRDLAELTGSVQIPLSTGRRIAVTSVCGGAGKSTVAGLLALVYAARRADPVLVADADPDGGSLAWRLGLTQYQPLSVLAPRLLTARSGDLRGLEQWLPRTANGLWVLPGGAAGQPRLARDVTRALSRLFGVCVTDCGRGVDEPSTVEIMSEAHGVIVVAPATPDGVRATCAVLDRVSVQQAASLPRVVVALNAVTRDSALRSGAALEALGRFGVPMVSIPYDRHIAGGAPITPSRIGEATLMEATRLAGHALARAWQL
jgi:MinD-like ATPase involved in chromosome partitioning or flagellar assembly